MTQHKVKVTPGSWHYRIEMDHLYFYNQDGIPIDCFSGCQSYDVMQANGRMMAHSKDMFEALIAIKKTLKAISNTFQDKTWYGFCDAEGTPLGDDLEGQLSTAQLIINQIVNPTLFDNER